MTDKAYQYNVLYKITWNDDFKEVPMIFAHLEFNNNGNVLEQTLESHLIATGNMAGNIGQHVGMEAFMKLAGYLHDLGKADRLFQDYIRNKTKQQVNHSSAGGRILDDLICADQELTNLKHSKAKFAYFQELLTYILLAHHGLYDLIPYGSTEYKTYQRLRYDEDGDYHYAEDVIPPFMGAWIEILLNIRKISGSLDRIQEKLNILAVELFDKYAIIIIPENLVNILAEYEEMEFIEKPKRISFEVNQERLVSCINPVQSGVYNLFGEGVYAGIIDSGIDYSHPDFRNEDGTTRIAVLWDQTIARNPPQGYDIGTVNIREQINEALAAPMPQRMNIVPSSDSSGHGTYVWCLKNN